MRIKVTISLLLIALIIGLLVFFVSSERLDKEHSIDVVATTEKNTLPKKPDQEVAQASATSGTEYARDLKEDLRDNKITKEEAWEKLYNTPIAFYGIVLDFDDNPINEAGVTLGAVNNHEGGTDYETQTAEDGTFGISGISGIQLHVRVSKEGYYKVGLEGEEEASNRTFDFSPLTPKPEPRAGTKNNPATFRLHKMGETEPLKYTKIKKKLPANQSAVRLNFTGTNNQIIEASFDKGSVVAGSRQYDWSFKLRVPGGGITRLEDQSKFEAPASGYQESYEIRMPKTLGDDWRKIVDDEVFVMFPDGTYGRLEMTVSAGTSEIIASAYHNPSGSRNIEYDPTKRITP